jgi:uncharacterized Zn finger protein (UPF0148 family)
MLSAAELKIEAAPQSACDAMQGLTNNQPVSEVRPMADANSLTRTVTFLYQDCRVCGAKHAPHYKASGGQFCVSCHKAYQREYRRRMEKGVQQINKDKKYALKKRYGISAKDFDSLGARQGWACAVCGVKFDVSQRATRPNVDHCHSTNFVRGLLCNGCNRALGFIGDDPQVARNLAAYLEGSISELEKRA